MLSNDLRKAIFFYINGKAINLNGSYAVIIINSAYCYQSNVFDTRKSAQRAQATQQQP